MPSEPNRTDGSPGGEVDGPEVLRAVDSGVLTVTLNRPAALNAITPRMLAELGDVLEAAAEDDTIRVVVLTGAGTAFSAGGDIAAMQDKIDRPELWDRTADALRRFRSYNRPGFHPDDWDSAAVLEHWSKELFDQDGSQRVIASSG